MKRDTVSGIFYSSCKRNAATALGPLAVNAVELSDQMIRRSQEVTFYLGLVIDELKRDWSSRSVSFLFSDVRDRRLCYQVLERNLLHFEVFSSIKSRLRTLPCDEVYFRTLLAECFSCVSADGLAHRHLEDVLQRWELHLARGLVHPLLDVFFRYCSAMKRRVICAAPSNATLQGERQVAPGLSESVVASQLKGGGV